MIKDVINGLNLMYEDDKSRFILHKTIDVNPTFKAVKTYKYELWFLKNRKKKLILSEVITDTVISDKHEEKLISELNTTLIVKLFTLMRSGEWEKLLN